MQDLPEYGQIAIEVVTRFGLNILAAIAIFVVGRWVAQAVRRFIRRIMSKNDGDPTLIAFVANLAYYLVLAVAIIAALNRVGVQTASLVAVVGAAGLAVGLALEGSLANFAAGVLLILFRPFRVGDLVEAGGVLGTVQEIQLFATRLTTPDGRRVIVPNSMVTGDKIINNTVEGKRRVDMLIGIAYEADLERAKQIITEVVAADPNVLQDPAPVVRVTELADSSVNFAVLPWADPAKFWDVHFSIHENVKKRLDAEGIAIPFPQQDVHLIQSN
ncbi:MAG: mechanosensitive ion channel [Leptolyngbya sp. SIOISBB]|nr:mechanosensitive ion channel [Leptolyngbya sp. SIOISBB]